MSIPLGILIALALVTLGIAFMVWANSAEHECGSAAFAIWGLVWLLIFALFWAGSYHATHGGWIPPRCRADPAPSDPPPASKEGE